MSPARPRRTRLVVAMVVVLLAAAVAAAVVGYRVVDGFDHDSTDRVSGDGDGGGDAVAAVADRASFLSEPGSTWTVDAADLDAAGFVSVTPDNHYGAQPATGSDVVLVQLSDDTTNYATDQTLAGLDAADGAELWRSDPGPFRSCRATPAGDAFTCWSGGELTLLDARTGEVQESGRVDDAVLDVGWDEDRLVVVSRPAAGSLVLSHGTVSAPDADWQQTYPDPPDEGSDGFGLSIADDEVVVSLGTSTWVADAATGDLIDSGGYLDGVLIDGLATVSGHESDGTTVTDEAGEVVFHDVGLAWFRMEAPSPVVDRRIGVGTALYDLASGERLWDRPDLGATDAIGWGWSADGRQVLVQDYEGEVLTVLAAHDGATLWSAPTYQPALETEDAFVAVDDTAISVLDRADGDVVWSADLPVAADEPIAGPVRTAATLVVGGPYAVHGFTGFAGDGSEPAEGGEGGTDYVTDCGSEPELTPVGSSNADGVLTVVVEATAVCPGGQWLDSSSATVTVTGPGGSTYASGVFDLSGTPFWLPEGEPVELPLRFPADSVFATPEEVSDGIATDVVRVDCVQDGPTAEPPADPDEGADPSEGGTAEAPGAEADGETALEALRRIAREDFASVGDELVGSWVPQLSSKRQGLNGADGSWSYEDILAEHQRLRLTFPNVKLLFSTQWNYERRGFWVTVTGLPSSGWRSPLEYCVDSGFDKDHCYAKLLDRRGGPDKHTTWFLTDADRVPRNGPTEPPSS